MHTPCEGYLAWPHTGTSSTRSHDRRDGPFKLTQILTHAQVELLAKAVNELLGPEFVAASSRLDLDTQRQLRFQAVAHQCAAARERRGLEIRGVAARLKVPQYRLKAIECGAASGGPCRSVTFIEAGTEQAADLGYGDENYFAALENKIDAVAKSWPTLPAESRTKAATRLGWVQQRAKAIGWGLGDYVRDVVARLKISEAEKPGSKNRARRPKS